LKNDRKSNSLYITHSVHIFSNKNHTESSVTEPHNFYAAPAPGKNFDATPAPAAPAPAAPAPAPAAPAPTLLYSKAKLLK
jgi:hypothetical protein